MNTTRTREHVLNRVRIVLGLLLAVTLLPAALGPAIPARAAESPAREDRDPVARVQIILKKILIIDDNDVGDGELIFQLGLVCFPAPAPCLGQSSAALDSYEKRFSAGDGETVTLNQPLPRSNETLNRLSDASVQVGYPVYSGQRYEIRFYMYEEDLFSSDDNLGDITVRLGQDNNWGIGTHTVRSSSGDYEVEYEIRPTPLPDLQPVSIEVVHLAGSTDDIVCMGVVNRGALDAGPFQVALLLNAVTPPIGTVDGGGLPSGQVGLQQLAAIVDAPRAVAEESEINNRLDYAYDPKAINDSPSPGGGSGPTAPPTPTPAPMPTPVPTASPALPDLVVSAIKVNGRVPDGKDGCKDGKNDVTVVVKNAGPKKAGDFVVRLVVDDDHGNALEQGVERLDPGEERNVKFGGVRLKKGPHSLTATADAVTGASIAESDEGNNTLKVTASCKDDDN